MWIQIWNYDFERKPSKTPLNCLVEVVISSVNYIQAPQIYSFFRVSFSNCFPIIMCNTNFAGILCISSKNLSGLSHCNVHHAGIFSRYSESLGSICFFSRYTSVPQVLTSITVPVSAVRHTWLRLINNPEQSVNMVALVLSVSQSQSTSDTLWKEICSQVTGEMSFGLCPSLPIHI